MQISSETEVCSKN